MLLAALTWDWLVGELHRPLVIFGFAAQFVFFLRFVVQWLVSERRGRSHIPIAFWYLSLIGGLMTFVYATLEQNLVFMTAQGLSVLIYVRNLMLIYRRRFRARARHRQVLMAGNRSLEQVSAAAQSARISPKAGT